MKDTRKQRSLVDSFTFYSRVPAIILTVAIFVTVALVVLDLYFPNVAFLIAIGGVVFFAFIMFLT